VQVGVHDFVAVFHKPIFKLKIQVNAVLRILLAQIR